MSKIVKSGKALALHTTNEPTMKTLYRLDGQDQDIGHSFIDLDVTGNDEEVVAAEVKIRVSKQWETVATRAPATMNDGESFVLHLTNTAGTLKALEVRRKGGCNPVFTFTVTATDSTGEDLWSPAREATR